MDVDARSVTKEVHCGVLLIGGRIVREATGALYRSKQLEGE
jgi:hypothetical protein